MPRTPIIGNFLIAGRKIFFCWVFHNFPTLS